MPTGNSVGSVSELLILFFIFDSLIISLSMIRFLPDYLSVIRRQQKGRNYPAPIMHTSFIYAASASGDGNSSA